MGEGRHTGRLPELRGNDGQEGEAEGGSKTDPAGDVSWADDCAIHWDNVKSQVATCCCSHHGVVYGGCTW